MMRAGPRSRMLMALAWLLAGGCTSLRELPRDDYAARPERKHVAVTTRDGRLQEFDYARFGPDTLVGFVRVDTEGAVDEFATVPVPLDDIVKLSARRLDWYRTALVGGVALAAVVAAALSLDKKAQPGTPAPPDTCTMEPCLP